MEGESKQQPSVWCDLTIAPSEQEGGHASDEEAGGHGSDEEENWVLGWRDADTGQTLTWDSEQKQPVVVTNAFRARERLVPGTLCEARDTDGVWKPAVVDRDMVAHRPTDSDGGVGPYLVTLLLQQHEVREAQPKEKKTKRRKKGDFW